MSDKPEVLLAVELPADSLVRLQAVFTVHLAVTPEARAAAAAQSGEKIRGIITNGTTVIDAGLLSSLPNLGVICAQGVGYEGIELAALRSRPVAVANSPNSNSDCVADHAMALMLAALRDVPRNDALVRGGGWRKGDLMRPIAYKKHVGILGMGEIGRRIAKRCAGFDMTVLYHNRRPLADAAWGYAATPLELARQSDILIIAVPGGAATRHIVGAAELEALGSHGFLVNIGRGSAVDTTALIAALKSNRLAGAALDVIEGEPEVPETLRSLPNIVFSPHIGGRSPESLLASVEHVIANLQAYFAGQPVLTPIPAFN